MRLIITGLDSEGREVSVTDKVYLYKVQIDVVVDRTVVQSIVDNINLLGNAVLETLRAYQLRER